VHHTDAARMSVRPPVAHWSPRHRS
jgi:hypothetical protein